MTRRDVALGLTVAVIWGLNFVLIATAGLGVIGLSLGEGGPIGAVALAVFGAFLWGCANVLLRGAGKIDMFALVVWSSVITVPPAAVLSLLLEGPARIAFAFTHLTVAAIFALLYVALVSTNVGYGLWAWLLRRYPASTIAPFALLVPPVAIVSSAIVYHEPFPALRLAGVVLILAGLVAIVVNGRPAVVPLPARAVSE